jgi:hypothetical protein
MTTKTATKVAEAIGMMARLEKAGYTVTIETNTPTEFTARAAADRDGFFVLFMVSTRKSLATNRWKSYFSHSSTSLLPYDISEGNYNISRARMNYLVNRDTRDWAATTAFHRSLAEVAAN